MEKVEITFNMQEEKDPFDCTKEELQAMREELFEKHSPDDTECFDEQEAVKASAGCLPCATVPPPKYIGQKYHSQKSIPCGPVNAHNYVKSDSSSLYHVRLEFFTDDDDYSDSSFYITATSIDQAIGRVLEMLPIKGISVKSVMSINVNRMNGEFIG